MQGGRGAAAAPPFSAAREARAREKAPPQPLRPQLGAREHAPPTHTPRVRGSRHPPTHTPLPIPTGDAPWSAPSGPPPAQTHTATIGYGIITLVGGGPPGNNSLKYEFFESGSGVLIDAFTITK